MNVPSLMPALYSHRLAEIQDVAVNCGYALAVHGSMQRDLDLIAVPWIEQAVSADILVETLAKRLKLERIETDPVQKPHGRKSWTLMMGGACFMDLSVLPREIERPTSQTQDDT